MIGVFMPGKSNFSRAATRLAADVLSSFAKPTSRSVTTTSQQHLIDASTSTGSILNELYRRSSGHRVVVNFDENFEPAGTQTFGSVPGYKRNSLFNQFAQLRMQEQDLKQRMQQQQQETQRPTKRK
jgi:hypothetical protein